MEEIELLSWMTLDALNHAAEVIEKVGNLQSGHTMSVFCQIEEDYLELCYSDTASNFLRRFEDREELDLALEKRKEETGDAPYEEDLSFDDAFTDDDEEEDFSESEEF